MICGLPPEGGPVFYQIHKKVSVRGISIDRPLLAL
jgi:hypothetical protein